MNTPHKHAALIKAWADGAEIQWRRGDEWMSCLPSPAWYEDKEYRIKPEPVVKYGRMSASGGQIIITPDAVYGPPCLELTFEDGVLIKAEVL